MKQPVAFALRAILFFLLTLFISDIASANNQLENQKIQARQTPDGLTQMEWGSIQQQVKMSKYRAFERDDGSYTAANVANGWHIDYGTDGRTRLTPYKPEDSNYFIGLQLKSVGYASQVDFQKPQTIASDETKLTYQWNDNVREVWINSASQLEQWFEIQQKPQGAKQGQQLTLQMALTTDLQVTQNGNALNFANKISYDKLKVWDSKGFEIPASMQLQNNVLTLVVDDNLAVYPLTIDPSFYQQAYLKASNTGISDTFGYSVAVSGDTVVVGAMGEDSGATGINGDEADNSANYSGAAYVFTRSGTVWSQQAYLKASNAKAGHDAYFGISVAISGDTVVVGARGEDSGATGVNGDEADISANWAGAAYVFTRSGTIWSQQAYLKASNTDAQDNFGISVAIDGNTLLVGAVGEASNATGVNHDQTNNSMREAGAAYVFTRSGTVWSQQAYLKASNTGAVDRFGSSVTIAGDTVVVGALWEDSNATGVNGDQSDNSVPNAGAAYVFTRSGTSWSQQAYLKTSNAYSAGEFGFAVAISADTLVVGALIEDSGAGAAYIFTRSGTVWSQQAFLKASDAFISDHFGRSVAISGDTVVVGAEAEGSGSTGVNGNEDDFSAIRSGAAYVFVRSDSEWSQQTYLKASNTGAGDNFGSSVAVSGDTVVIGAAMEDSDSTGINGDETDNSVTNAGAAYVFNLGLSVGGSVSGLAIGSNVRLQNNTGDDLTVDSNGNFTFKTGLADGSAYAVTVKTQPTSPSQTCSVTDGSGTLAGSDITNVQVTCITDTFTVGGNVSGLAGTGLVLQNNVGDDLSISTDGSFNFVTAIVDGADYAVTVKTQPTNPSETCSVTNGSGTLTGSNITNVQVSCITDTFAVGGNVTGLSGAGLVLQNNVGDDLSVSADGEFTFVTALDDGSGYAVTVKTQPSNLSQTCGVTNGSGTLASSEITNVQVTCVTDTFIVGGNVSGLAGTGLVLQNNAGDDLPVTSDGNFTFATPLDDGSPYIVTVRTQPTGLNQRCNVSSGSGNLAGTDIAGVMVTCITDTYSVGGSVNDLSGTGLVLQNNAGNDLEISSDGAFTFSTKLADGIGYTVTTKTQPTDPSQTCSIISGSGTLAGADVTDVAITCITDTFTTGGNVSGLFGTGLVLQNMTGDDLTIEGNGSFTFATELLDGSTYSITVLTQPTTPSQTCSVSSGSGTLAGSDITSVTVTCTTNTYSVGGSVSGLSGSGLVLQNNAGDDLSISTDGSFNFDTAIVDGTGYEVTIKTQPSNLSQICGVTNGSGTLGGANVTNVSVTCVTDTFTVGGNVTGLSGDVLVLQNNAGDDLSISANGSFTFDTELLDGSTYDVSVLEQPNSVDKGCIVINGSGTVSGSPITNISISCVNTYRVGGTVSGLFGSGLVLQNNAGDNLDVFGNGSFTFATAQADGSDYVVTVLNQPANLSQTCSVTNGTGTLAGADVTNVSVTCVTNKFTIGGNVSGLAGTGLVLQNNAGDDLSILNDGSFTFATTIIDGADYAVTVKTQPTNPSETCSVTNGSGTLAGSAISNISVTCVTNKFTIGGDVNGLSGSGLVLQNNAEDDLAISGNGSFIFDTSITDGTGYAVTVKTQPIDLSQKCSVINGSGTLAGAAVTNITVNCITDTFKIGGTVSGLASSGLVLRDNAGDELAIGANGIFTFPTMLLDGTSYAVTVWSHPNGQTCTVTNGSDTLAGANVTNVLVTCAISFKIGGNVSGLGGSGLVLQNNAGDDLSISGNGSFTFATGVVNVGGYAVTIKTQPTSPSQNCAVTNGSGTVVGASVTDVVVTCVTNKFTIGGSVSGLTGTGLVLQNNAGDDLSITDNDSFTFSTEPDDVTDYAVTVKTQPTTPSQTCSVSNGSGTLAGSDITSVTVTCVTDTFTVGGSASGLVGSGLVLQNNVGDDLSVPTDGSFTFATALDDGSGYAVTVKNQPTSPSQTCSVTNGSGTLAGANVTDVTVTCITLDEIIFKDGFE